MALLLLFVQGFGSAARAQDAYYWAFDEPQTLFPNPSAVLVTLEAGTSLPVVAQRKLPAGISEVKLMARSEQLMVKLTQPLAGQPDQVALHLGLPPQSVKQVIPGWKLADGLDLWLSNRLAFMPGPHYQPEALEALLRGYTGAQLRPARFGRHLEITLPDPAATLPLANAIYEAGLAEWSQPDFVVSARAYNNKPDDPYYDQLYYLESDGTKFFNKEIGLTRALADNDLDALDAWKITKGSSDITIALIDEGLDEHEDLKDSLGNSRILPGFCPTDSTNTGQPLFDSTAHGMGCAGIMAASHNNKGVSGIAPEVKLLPVTVRFGGGTMSEYAEAIDWAWQNGADVINISWGIPRECDPNFSPLVKQAITDAITLGRNGRGCVITAAAGNDANCVSFPASIPGVIAVGAIDHEGDHSSYSNFGPDLDLVAPTAYSLDQSNIHTLDRPDTLGYNSGGYWDLAEIQYTRWFGGTSAACSQVAGVAALLLSFDDNLNQADVRSLLLNSANDIGAQGFDNLFGYGRVNAHDALVLLQNSNFPVEFSQFFGRWEGGTVALSWETLSELQNDFFAVERSANGTSFTVLGTLAGAGNSQTVQQYHFRDLAPLASRNYYRLQQVDLDGSFSYSPVIQIQAGEAPLGLLNLYPQPAQDQLTLQWASEGAGTLRVELLDLRGRSLLRQAHSLSAGQSAVPLSLPALPPGSYLLQLQPATGPVVRQKLLIKP